MTELMLPRTLLDAGPADGDWGDVVRRVRFARRRRRAGVLVAVAASIVVGFASAYALGHPIVDFHGAPKGTKQIVNDFGSLEVGAPPGMAPGVVPEEARRITSVTFDGKAHVLWVAPTKEGGFCAQWSKLFGGCRPDRNDPTSPKLSVSIFAADKNTGVAVIGGSFFQRGGDRLEVAYADESSEEIPFVWVTEPIDAGFFLYRVPDAHRVHDARPVSITLFDRHGKTLAREQVIDLAAEPGQVEHRVDGYPALAVPANAIWDEREQLFDYRADNGDRLGLWVAPEEGGGTCFWTTQATGCSRVGGRTFDVPPLALGFSGGPTVSLCCQAGDGVARVEARFEDGDVVELTPKRGYLLWPIPSRHYALGHRLNLLIGYDADGREIARRRENPSTPGLYPCEKPKDYGYGVRQCP